MNYTSWSNTSRFRSFSSVSGAVIEISIHWSLVPFPMPLEVWHFEAALPAVLHKPKRSFKTAVGDGVGSPRCLCLGTLILLKLCRERVCHNTVYLIVLQHRWGECAFAGVLHRLNASSAHVGPGQTLEAWSESQYRIVISQGFRTSVNKPGALPKTLSCPKSPALWAWHELTGIVKLFLWLLGWRSCKLVSATGSAQLCSDLALRRHKTELPQPRTVPEIIISTSN